MEIRIFAFFAAIAATSRAVPTPDVSSSVIRGIFVVAHFNYAGNVSYKVTSAPRNFLEVEGRSDVGGRMLELRNLTDAVPSVDALQSGADRLTIVGAHMKGNTITVTKDSIVTVKQSAVQTRKRRTVSGSRDVIVVRVVAADASTTASEAVLSDKVFGTAGDVVNLRSQYLACSDGQASFDPFNGPTSTGAMVSNGVTTVTIPSNVIGADGLTIMNEVLAVGKLALGDWSLQFDHVLVVLPPGTTTPVGWLVDAMENHWLSVYVFASFRPSPDDQMKS